MILASWTLPTLIVGPLIVLLLVVGTFITGWAVKDHLRERRQRKAAGSYYFKNNDALVASWIVGGLTFLIGLAGLAGFYPLKKEYHYWAETSGTVETVDKRIVGGSDGSISEKFVVRYTDGRERGCLDTRCGSVRPGDTLVLTCKRAWQYTGTDGYDCNFVENRRQA